MLDLARLAATPLEIKVGERAYRLAPLTLGQLGTVEAWARERIFADLPGKLQAINKSKLDRAEAEKLRAQLVSDSDRASRDPLEIAKVMDSVAGQRKSFELAARACQDVSDKELDEICSLAGMQQIRKWVESALDGGQEPAPAPKAPPPNPPEAPASPSPSA